MMRSRVVWAVVCALAVSGAVTGVASGAKKPPPDTTITSAPSGTVNSSTATFAFRSSDSHASFQCRLDSFSWTSCRSPLTIKSLRDGQHTFSVRATGQNGTDPSPATVTWTVDTVPPAVPTITSAPASPTASRDASFSFSSSQSGVSFMCTLDGAAAQPCTSPTAYHGVVDGTHTFGVAARDAAGNLSTQKTAQWTVDATAPPTPTLSSRPDASTSATTATFAFTDRETGVKFLCSLDGATASPCTSPTTYNGLAAGSHTFAVSAADSMGNTSAAAQYAWSIQSDVIVNGSFEGSTTGWSGTAATLSLASDGTVGSSAAKVALATGADGQQYFIFPSTRPVTAATAGWTYTATAFVRSDVPGRQVCLRIREFANGSAINNKDECLTTTAAWQKFPAMAYTPATGNQLSVWVYQNAGVAGDSFEVDGISLFGGAPPAAGGGDPVVMAAGDVACAPTDPDYNNGVGQNGRCMQKATADLIGSVPGVAAVLSLGDQQYECGQLANFNAVYDLTWGRFKSITYPVPGNHEYGDSDSCASKDPNASGYFGYWGSLAGDPTKGYYSFDIGNWHIVALNSECWFVSCAAGSPQETWLKSDLAASNAKCTLAYWHIPRWSAGQTGDVSSYDAFWQDLYAAHADLVLNGHDHSYQRWARLNPSGAADTAGPRQVIVGTGGEEIFPTVLADRPALTVKNNASFGVLKLTLHPTSYDATFMPAAGSTFTDSFSTACN